MGGSGGGLGTVWLGLWLKNIAAGSFVTGLFAGREQIEAQSRVEVAGELRAAGPLGAPLLRGLPRSSWHSDIGCRRLRAGRVQRAKQHEDGNQRERHHNAQLLPVLGANLQLFSLNKVSSFKPRRTNPPCCSPRSMLFRMKNILSRSSALMNFTVFR